MKLGTYNYLAVDWSSPRRCQGSPGLSPHSVRVEILSENKSTMAIKLLGYHVDGRPPGTFMTVQKSKVTPDIPDIPDIPEQRLPYKDD